MDALNRIYTLLRQINLPCTDNGKNFLRQDRYNAIKSILKPSTDYQIMHDHGLSLIYKHKFNTLQQEESLKRPKILLSTHIDALYSIFFQRKVQREYWLGSLDNVITNAIIIDLMMQQEFPPEVLVAFTGNEEHNSIGADETAMILKEKKIKIGLVIVLDVTDSGFKQVSFTMENYVFHQSPGVKLSFESFEQFREFLQSLIPEAKTIYIPFGEAPPDETAIYANENLNTFSLCLPTAAHSTNKRKNWYEWMHSDKGIKIITSDLLVYRETLKNLCQRMITA